MSEKIDLLLRAIDRVRVTAEEAAIECGLPDGPIAAFFQKPKSRTDWLLQLAIQGGERNPMLVNFLTERMPEPAVHQRTAHHKGPRKKAATA